MKSKLLSDIPGVFHGFGTLQEPIPADFAEDWEKKKVQWWQVHGTDVAEAEYPGQNCGKVDASYTRKMGLPIGVVTADCVPILLARKDGGAVAAVHAGWRGTQARILKALWGKLGSEGEKPSEWVAAIGPAIGPCCYEVSEELVQDFQKRFGSWAGAVPSPRKLDLAEVNQRELRELGVKEIDVLRSCTRCSTVVSLGANTPLFHSFRREGGGSRQYSLIMIATQRVLK
jgi:YfiH family protein